MLLKIFFAIKSFNRHFDESVALLFRRRHKRRRCRHKRRRCRHKKRRDVGVFEKRFRMKPKTLHDYNNHN